MAMRGLVAILALESAMACEGEREQEVRREAGRLSRSIDELRAASNAEKRPRLLAMRQLTCSEKDVCKARDACVDAYAHYVRSVEAKNAVRRDLDNDGGSDRSAELLERSRRDLERSRELNRKCLAEQGALRRRYRL